MTKSLLCDRSSWVLVLVMLMLPFSGAGIDLISPSLPHIAATFDMSSTTTRFVISIYLFGLCFGQIFFGALSDSYGRKRTALLGLVLFLFSSLLILICDNALTLIFFRFFQGFSAGAVAVNARSMITDKFSPKEITRISAYMSLAWSIGPILAPLLGGYIQYYFQWKICIFILFGYACFIMSIFLFTKETMSESQDFSLQRIYKNFKFVLSHSRFQGAVLMMGAGFTILIVYAIFLPFITQELLHYSSKTYGDLTLLIGFSYLLGSLCYRKLSSQFTKNMILSFGIYTMLFSSLIMVITAHFFGTNLVTLYVLLFPLTACVGIIFPCCLSECISLFPKQAGAASATAGACFMIISSIATSILGQFNIKSSFEISIILLIISVLLYAMYHYFFRQKKIDSELNQLSTQ